MLWVTDASASGTRLVQKFLFLEPFGAPNGFVSAGPNIFFTAGGDRVGVELWVIPRDAL